MRKHILYIEARSSTVHMNSEDFLQLHRAVDTALPIVLL